MVDFKSKEKELLKLLNDKATEADKYHGEKAMEVDEGLQYYHGELPKPQSSGSSKYIDRTVFEAVESLMPQLTATFASDGPDAVRLSMHGVDPEAEKQLNQYINDNIMHEQDGFNIITTFLKDALTNKIGIAKVEWDRDRKIQEMDVTDVNEVQLAALITKLEQSGLEIDEKLTKLEVKKGMYNGKLAVSSDISKPRIDIIDFANFRYSPQTHNMKDCDYSSYLYTTTIAELLGDGYKKKDILEQGRLNEGWAFVNTIASSTRFRFNEVSDAELGYVDNGSSVKNDAVVIMEEAYLKTSLFREKEQVLYQVIRLGDKILEVNEVDRNPFVVSTPILISGSLCGFSIPDITKDLQDAKTWSMRAVFDNAAASTWNRWIAKKGSYDKKGVINSTHNSILEVNEDNALIPVMAPQLGTGVLTALQTIEADKAERTGVSAAAKGLNEDVFNSNNAASMVDQMVSQSEARIRLIARTLAHNGIGHLIEQVYMCFKDNYKKPFPVGNTQITMEDLPDVVQVDVDVNLGSGEKSEAAGTLLGLIGQMTADPAMARVFSEQNKYAMYKEAMSKLGIEEVEKFLTDPSTIPQPQPTPQEKMVEHFTLESMQLDNETKAQNIQANELEMQVKASTHTHDMEMEAAKQEAMADEQDRADAKLEIDAANMVQNQVNEDAKLALEEEKQKWQIMKDTAEIEIEATQGRPVGID